jgi:excisionase family DNA binding protein
MSDEIYTVDQFARRLKLHPKTVLRFIREGRVRAVKVGRSWRILASELEAFGGVPPPQDAVGARVTAIVDAPDISPERAQALASFVTSLRMGSETPARAMSLDVAHDPARRHVKVVILGSPQDTAALLQVLGFWLDQGR